MKTLINFQYWNYENKNSRKTYRNTPSLWFKILIKQMLEPVRLHARGLTIRCTRHDSFFVFGAQPLEQEGYIQEVQLPALYLKFYGGEKSWHIFDRDRSCAIKIPHIRTGVSAVRGWKSNIRKSWTSKVPSAMSCWQTISDVARQQGLVTHFRGIQLV